MDAITPYAGWIVLALAPVVAFLLWMRLPKPFTLVLPADIKEQASKIDYPSYTLPRVCMVTGGNGFLGGNIVQVLRRNGVRVVVFDISEKAWKDSEVVCVKGDLTRGEEVDAALRTHGVELVFHVASPDPNSMNKRLFQAVNVDGTRTLLASCASAGVRGLIFTSSASVVWQGAPQEGVDESAPYPAVFRDAYAETKAIAEQLVCDAGKGDFITISLRPHAIFGPGDRTLLPTAVELCKAGRQGTIVGSGDNVVDWTFVNNVVHAHMLAAATAYAAMRAGTRCAASGKTYFITNGEPMKFWDFMNWLFLGMGFPVATRRVPYALVLGIAHVAQSVVSFINSLRGSGARPITLTLSPSRIAIAGTAHWYNITAAKRDLKYAPLWNMHQALYLTLRAFTNIRNLRPPPAVLAAGRAGNLIAAGLMTDWEAAASAHIERDNRQGPAFRSKDDPDMPSFTLAEVAEHTSAGDAWLAVDGYVYDVTTYLKVHQPGPAPILKKAGTDASAAFHGPQHPEHAPTTLTRFLIGKLKA